MLRGGVAACCGAIERNDNPLMIGNINVNTICELWNADRINKVRNIILTNKYILKSCKSCHIKDILSKYDVLDDAVDRLKEIYEV